MWENAQKILEIVYYVIVPLGGIFLNWIKSSHDLKRENKQLRYWAIEFREIPTFKEIAMQTYKILAVILVISILIKQSLIVLGINNFLTAIVNLFYFFIGAICIILVIGNRKTRVECFKNGKEKKFLLFVLYLIFGMVLCLIEYKEIKYLLSILFSISLLTWMYYMYKYSDRVAVLDNRYANIYVRNSEVAEFVEAASIKKKGLWIIAKRYVNGYDEEIRIKENDIIRIDYYGEPLIVVTPDFLFGIRNKK
ncbi:MAG: hypothetical protein NC094_03560 [Bacteroidales bacterium]|nr:hypothetical protein [Lachnoclostridium sp.]MCM1383873.1 hypothetical protein [Lachnoclostridium sp.]MCM1464474.1 hypothetical protein [Bacteroidales bacterium]